MFPALLQLCNSSGLCNRLRGWVGVGTLADLYNLSFMVYWKAMSVCECNFNNVFVPDSCGLMTSIHDRGKYNFLREYTGKRAVAITEWFRDRFVGDSHLFWKKAKERCRALQLRPEHVDQLERFMESVPKASIGLHVRRTDLHQHDKSDPALFAELDQIISEEPDATFLLCADNPRSIEQLRQRYADRIFWRTQHMKDHKRRKHRFTSEIDAAIDLYALARTKRIIGAVYSSFCGYAAFLGGIPLKRV